MVTGALKEKRLGYLQGQGGQGQATLPSLPGVQGIIISHLHNLSPRQCPCFHTCPLLKPLSASTTVS